MYITIDDLVARYPLDTLAQLTDDTNGRTVDNAVLAVLIAESETVVNGYLRDRYSLPLSPVPEDIKGCICALVYARAWRRRNDTLPQGVTDAHNAAIDYLNKVTRGVIILEMPENVSAPILPTNVTNKRGVPKVMSSLTSRMP